MANFELRIYVIPSENFDEICEDKQLHDMSDLTDEQIVEIAEEIGNVYSLGTFLGLDVIAPDTDYIKAYYIDKDNESTAPIPADGYNTVLSVQKVTRTEFTSDTKKDVVLFEDNSGRPFGKCIKSEEPISRTYTIVITIDDNDTHYEGIEGNLQDCEYIQDVELIGSVDNKYRVQVETDSDIDFDKLCSYIENEWEVDVELIEEVENY